jgi:hypothetical protein
MGRMIGGMDGNLAGFACAWLLLGLTLPALGQGGGGAAAASADSGLARQFESKVAPLMMKHCLECHGATSKRGRLDLSRKDAAFAGGENGAAIVPGKPDENLPWLGTVAISARRLARRCSSSSRSIVWPRPFRHDHVRLFFLQAGLQIEHFGVPRVHLPVDGVDRLEKPEKTR